MLNSGKKLQYPGGKTFFPPIQSSQLQYIIKWFVVQNCPFSCLITITVHDRVMKDSLSVAKSQSLSELYNKIYFSYIVELN